MSVAEQPPGDAADDAPGRRAQPAHERAEQAAERAAELRLRRGDPAQGPDRAAVAEEHLITRPAAQRPGA